MADTVNVGGAHVPKNGVKVFAVIAVALVGYGLWKSHKTQQAAASSSPSSSSTSPGAYPPDGTTGNPSDPYSTDPATGMTYGDESGAGYAPAVAIGSYGYGGYGYGGGSPFGFNTGGFGPLPGGGGSGPSPGNFTSNAQWAQYAEQFMGSNGNDSISAAIGKYITGQPVTSDQQSTIEQAIAIAGYPPVAGPEGYPPAMHVSSPSAPPPPATIPVPNVVGQTAGAAHNTLVAAGLVPRDPSGAVRGEYAWKVVGESPPAGTQVAKGSQVSIFAQR